MTAPHIAPKGSEPVNSTLSTIVGVLQMFFSKNPTAEEILSIIEQVGPAVVAAKQGQAFSVSFAESIDGKPGTSTFGWSPNP